MCENRQNNPDSKRESDLPMLTLQGLVMKWRDQINTCYSMRRLIISQAPALNYEVYTLLSKPLNGDDKEGAILYLSPLSSISITPPTYKWVPLIRHLVTTPPTLYSIYKV